MPQFSSPLNNVKVAAPCSADWNQMSGNEQVRFCNLCELNVYNLSALTRREAEQLLLEREGRLCVRFYRRADGSILTANCPTGIALLKQRAKRVATAVFSIFAAFVSGLGLHRATTSVLHEPEPVMQGAVAVSPVKPLPNQSYQSEDNPPIRETSPPSNAVMGGISVNDTSSVAILGRVASMPEATEERLSPKQSHKGRK